MIAVAQDAEGLRIAAIELLDEAFEAPERERIERIAEMSSNPEEVLRASAPKRSLSPGYYLWLGFVIEEVERPLNAGIAFREEELTAEELLGLKIMLAAREGFRRKHPPCRRCGTPVRNEWEKLCAGCEFDAATARV